MSRVVRKPDFCLGENKGADQLRSNYEADKRLCFRYTDSTISLILKYEVSSFYPASVTAQAILCQTWSEIPDRFSRVAAHNDGHADKATHQQDQYGQYLSKSHIFTIIFYSSNVNLAFIF